MLRFLRVSGLIFSAMLLFAPIVLAEEEITITTYYPSPYGSYNQLQTNALGVGDNNGNGGLDSGDVPDPAANPGGAWIKGKVGIGTTGPTTKLEVKAGHGDTELRLFSDNYGQGLGGVNTANLNLWASEPGWTWTGAGIGNNTWILDSGGIGRVTTNRGGSYIRLLDNTMVLDVVDSVGTDRNGITINGAGNVGIGTTGPGAKLDVAGNVKIADGTQGAGKVLTSDASGLASWQVAGGMPSGFCIFSDTQASCPSGWTRRTQFDGRTVRGAATPGGTGGSDTHNHYRIPPDWRCDSCGGIGTGGNQHNDVTSSSSWPPYINVLVCCKN